MTAASDILAADGDAAETAPTPEGGDRRNHGRSVMFSVRLNPDELAELQRRAEERGLPARTLARAWILQAMREDDSLGQRVSRLEQTVFGMGA